MVYGICGMKETRHPHPHVDPRRPRHQERPETNPPVFVWKPEGAEEEYRLQVSRTPDFSEVALDVKGLSEPFYLPKRPLAIGPYFWRWRPGDETSEVFTFEITSDAVSLPIPSVRRWMRRFPGEHPRIFVRPEQVPELRRSREGRRAEPWTHLQHTADKLLDELHEMPEPPFLPDRTSNYDERARLWFDIMSSTRRFMSGAETLALAYLAGGDEQYARAACRRMVSVARWDPEGSTFIRYNDEPHMSVLWWGPTTCDWVWQRFTDDERALVARHFRHRGFLTYEHVHDEGLYGVTRFDSHAGREIVFLAMVALVFYEYIPEARRWLDWLRQVLCGVWPLWGGEDGSWAEGVAYSTPYVSVMSMFATALKVGAGVDLYRRPFWERHARWRRAFFPAYAEWVGFGDHTERCRHLWEMNTDLVDIIQRQTGVVELRDYVETFREEGRRLPEDTNGAWIVNPQTYLIPEVESDATILANEETLSVYSSTGCASIRTAPDDPTQDVAFLFRSSPFGSIGHSHANNNDFILHVAGHVMAMPSGYYDHFGSPHHRHWVWHTKSHNCVTLSDASQLLRSPDSRGAVERVLEDDRLIYFRGNADAAYAQQAERCRRHVVFLKRQTTFVLIDEFRAKPGVCSSFQWNLHSWARFQVDEAQRRFVLRREGSKLEGYLMWHAAGFFSLTEGWDPAPSATMKSQLQQEWRPQHHLRFTPLDMQSQVNFAAILCPSHADLKPPFVRTVSTGGGEAAHVGGDLLLIEQFEPTDEEDKEQGALAVLTVQGQRYEITDTGIAHVEAKDRPKPPLRPKAKPPAEGET